MRGIVIKRQIKCIKPIEKHRKLKIKKPAKQIKKSKKQTNKSVKIPGCLKKNRKINSNNKKMKIKLKLMISYE